MTAPLRQVLVKRPGPAFGRAFDDPAHGFLRPVDLAVAQREHDAFVDLLAGLGPAVHELGSESASPDLVYQFDPLLVTETGCDPAPTGQAQPTRRGAAHRGLAERPRRPDDRPDRGARDDRGRRHVLAAARHCCASAGRCERTRPAPDQLGAIVGGDVRIFDLPYWRGPAELVHLLSVISPVADDLAVVFLPLLPVGLRQLLEERSIRLIAVADEEFATLGCNVLAVRPGVVILAEGNPGISAGPWPAPVARFIAYAATEIGLNGSGGPTCLTRPIWRETNG